MPGGSRVGPYRILRLIKRGGQGQVFLGYDGRLQRPVAIKIYPLPASRRARRQLLREARQVAGIQSPKVVQVHDVIQSSDHLAMVMEYVPGCDLEELLARTRLSLPSVLQVAADIASALAAARQQRIVHGDLKAANVLVTANGRVKLTDFGIATREGAGVAGGSLSALSPEQLDGRPLDVRTDLFALGCLLYRMLTGDQPFCRNGRLDPAALRMADTVPIAQRLPPELELPPALEQLVGELLQADPAQRPANTHRVRRLLRRASQGLPLSAGHSLLQEARPSFRAEAAEDIPPPVPADLGRQGRSRLSMPWQQWRPGPRTVPAVLCLLAALVGATAYALSRPAPVVHLAQANLQVLEDGGLPASVSGPWLQREVAGALGQLQRVELVGLANPGTLNAARMANGSKPDEKLLTSLRCDRLFCLLSLERQRGGLSSQQQVLLYPDASEERWRQAVWQVTEALYH